ncbi:PPE domain-containing protein [Rhodococcus opacus]|uniref:PPE domain-containing protein n=1 Tax=Rhodococcus opacus (strain B4) TaxID=632772 RepID=C1AX55_RHOOB|nr:PPE domain-containing protein [Rhodococcus opacus]BAH49559.1 hypothetical protein ROP_13120 [Rhodococcus opacus B4]
MNGRENFHSGAWDHRAISSAVDALKPAESGAVAASWDDLGRKFREAVAAFHDATRAAVDTGWRGPSATAVAAALDDYAARAEQVGGRFTDVGDALRHASAGAEAVRGAVGRPVDHPADWTRVLPGNWTAEADADAAEQDAKAAMDTLYASAYRTADDRLPTDGLAATHAAATALGQPVGFDIGPNGVHGVPSDGQVAEPESETATAPRGEPRETDDVPPRDAQAAPGPIAGALAGAVGGGVAHYAHGIVAAHRASTPERPAAPALPAAREAEEEPPTYLESIDEGSELVGKLPLVTPAVIGE